MRRGARPGRCVAGWVLGLLLAGVGLGCATPTPILSPAERLTLSNRALTLLITAAESDLADASANAIEALVRVAPREGAPAYRRALRSESPMVRYAGYLALGETGLCEPLPQLVAGTQDPHPNVRLAAAFALVRCGREGYVRILMRALNTDANDAVRADAAALLGRLDNRRAVTWLEAARDQPANANSARVTVAIRGALARLGEGQAIHDLVRHSQGEPATRTDAMLLLAEIGPNAARDALRVRVAPRRENRIEDRLLAARGLGRLGDKIGFDLALRHLTYRSRSRDGRVSPEHETFVVRSLAVHALAEIRDERALAALQRVAETETDIRLQVAAAYAILRITGP
ncbi:MAG: HEAT repeat domain-containing protein [Phycisphaerales bacterium]|nr:HEAT repeat domain-containing protein [Phycisphaerales bacterium]